VSGRFGLVINHLWDGLRRNSRVSVSMFSGLGDERGVLRLVSSSIVSLDLFLEKKFKLVTV
jgi:hypothetical protein